MVELSDLDLFPAPAGPRAGAAEPRKCRRHQWLVENYAGYVDGEPAYIPTDRCLRCRKWRDETASRRGKNNRARGNAIEREVGRKLGLRRVGQYGGPDDLSGEMFAAQVKSGGAFSERFWAWLRAVPVNAGQTPLLVVTDAPGPGHRRRAVVVIDLDDWAALHGDAA